MTGAEHSVSSTGELAGNGRLGKCPLDGGTQQSNFERVDVHVPRTKPATKTLAEV
jgi:hypothetical protein